jgi:hypothetical protein
VRAGPARSSVRLAETVTALRPAAWSSGAVCRPAAAHRRHRPCGACVGQPLRGPRLCFEYSDPRSRNRRAAQLAPCTRSTWLRLPCSFTCLVSSSTRRDDRPGIDQISVTHESTQIAIQQVTAARRDAEPAAWCWRPVGVDGADPVSQPRKAEVGPSPGEPVFVVPARDEQAGTDVDAVKTHRLAVRRARPALSYAGRADSCWLAVAGLCVFLYLLDIRLVEDHWAGGD